MRTLALTVAYDGTDWAGFQRQRRRPSIQGALEAALGEALRHPVRIAAAGRTDAGVHALGQVISLRTGNPMAVERIPGVANRLLPPSIRVRDAAERPDGFHARRSAWWRRYWYVLHATRWSDPLRGRFRWQLAGDLDTAAMAEALEAVRGRHDFAAFCHGGPGGGGTVRTVQRALVRRRHECVIIDLQADAFLRQMIRLLVANLLAVGRGERPPRWLQEVLSSRDRHLAGRGAPAHGLVLMRIGYHPALLPPFGAPRME